MNPLLSDPVRTAPPGLPSPELNCAVVTDPDAVEGLRAEWLELLGRSEADEVMLTPTWLLTWWKVYGERAGRRLRVGLFRERGRLVGLAPLTARRFHYCPGIPFRRLEPLGADVSEGDGVCSDYLNVLAERGAEPRVARALARGLLAGVFGGWDEVVLPVMNGEGVMPGLLAEALADTGLQVATSRTDEAPYIPLPATWDDYLKALPKKKRYGVTSALRRFDAWAGGQAELRRAHTSAELEEGKRVLQGLHGQRWQEAGQAGVFAAPRFAAFHDAVMPRLLREGALELAWLTVRGRPVAAAYNLVRSGKVSYYQCGRSPDVPDAVRPGIVLLARLIRAAIEAGRREFDFLAGVSVYKSQLALAARPLVLFRAARPSLREWLRCGAERGLEWARTVRNGARGTARWLRRGTDRPGAQAKAPPGR
jgi:CelD/BcsL family acetyltransferase involved in cellulose biosynthesis